MAHECGIIVAMNADRVIGKGGSIPWHYSADLKRFKRLTLHSTIIMGRKTWDSLPIKPLPERQNIVLTRTTSPNVEHYQTLDEAIERAEHDRIWFIGGAAIYEMAVNLCDSMEITYVPDDVVGSDCVHFPEIDWSYWIPGPKTPFEDDDRLFRQQYRFKSELRINENQT